ncbi:MAG: thermonuclease family protein [Cyanophyceae cyanobacterium]
MVNARGSEGLGDIIMRVARLTAVIKGAIRRTQSLSRPARRSSFPPRKSASGILLKSLVSGSLAAGGMMAGLPQLSAPVAALESINRPALSQTRRAEVMQVLDVNRLAVRLEGEISVRVVELIGLSGIPSINPAWTALTQQMPMPVYLAAQYLQDTVSGGFVDLEFDPRLGSTTNEPMLAYVWKANTFVNREMLFRGHAPFMRTSVPTKYGNALQEASDVAQRQGRGIWSFYGPQPIVGGSQPQPAGEPNLPFETPLDAIGTAIK